MRSSPSSRWTDRQYLQEEQYRDSGKLDARAALHHRFSTNDYAWQCWVFDQFELPKEARILEVGCGPGDLWVENRARLGPSWDLTLTDLSPGMVRRARQRLGDNSHGIAYAAVDAQSVPFPSSSFDAVVANHCLYHAPRLNELLHEVYRVLIPGGRFYAATNSLEHMRELRALVSRFVPGSDTSNVVEPFCLENAEAQLRALFPEVSLRRQENGLVVTEPEAVVNYVRSYVNEERGASGLAALASWVRRRIAVHGALTISKDAGLLAAVK